MSPTLRDLVNRHTEAIFSHTPSGPSLGQQAQSVEALRTRTLPQAITATSTASMKRKREPRPKLDNEKCARCRKDKVKCSPHPRAWPDKCERCSSKGFECSPGEVKRRARRKVSPNLPILSASEPNLLDDQTSNVPHDGGQGHVEPRVENGEGDWDCTDLTNLVTFMQLLEQERSLCAEAELNFKRLSLQIAVDYFIGVSYETDALHDCLSLLRKHVRQILCDRQHSDNPTITDRVLYQNALEAINEGFVVPKYDPVSEELLAKLPVGVQIPYLVRKLRLDIQRCGSCDFRPLDKLVSQLMLELLAWRERFDEWTGYWSKDRVFGLSDTVKGAAYSLVVSRELVTEVLPRIWVRNQIMQSDSETSPFPMAEFAEVWNTDRHSTNFLILAGHERDSEELPLLLVAVLSNKPRIVRALVNNSLNTEPTLHGYSSFHLAASVGSVDCYRELLRCENGKAMEGEPADDGDLPLHLAVKNGHKDMVDYILGLHSDDSEYVNERNCIGETPLIQAAKYGKFDVVQFLLDYPGVDTAASDNHGETALFRACENEDIFRLILSKVPDQYLNAPDDYGDTPLYWLVKYAGEKSMQTVLSVPSILPDKIGEGGRTPLCNAVRLGNLEAVKVLGIRRDVDVTKLCKTPVSLGSRESVIQNAKNRAQEGNKGNKLSQILNWLKLHCKELEADLADWEISNEGDSEGAGGSDQAT